MIKYNPKDWFTFIFRVHKGDTIRTLAPLMLGLAIYAALIVFLEKEYFSLQDSSPLKNIPLMHAILGGVISLLLVFRTNSAYDRWWEGRKLWGDLTNNSRNLALKIHAYLPESDEENRSYYRKMIPSYAFALKNHLLSNKADWELFDKSMRSGLLSSIDKEKHVPNQIANLLLHHTNILYKNGLFTDVQFMNLNEETKSFTNICGACERIKNTPIPFSYSVFIKKFVFGYVMTLPFGYSFTLGFLSIPIIVFIFYVLASLELIAEEIEDPFGGDSNDLPTDKMSLNIHHNVDDIFRLRFHGMDK
jgi:putative membrane protein